MSDTHGFEFFKFDIFVFMMSAKPWCHSFRERYFPKAVSWTILRILEGLCSQAPLVNSHAVPTLRTFVTLPLWKQLRQNNSWRSYLRLTTLTEPKGSTMAKPMILPPANFSKDRNRFREVNHMSGFTKVGSLTFRSRSVLGPDPGLQCGWLIGHSRIRGGNRGTPKE